MAILLRREFVRAAGPDTVRYLQSMLSNDVEAARPGGGVYALLLTPKARVIADIEVFNTGSELVLACAPELRDRVLETLQRARFRSKVELEPAEYALVWGEVPGALATLATPIGPELLLSGPPSEQGSLEEWETARIEAGIPRYGREFDADSMPAEAGLVPLAVSFTKGCYPGQEPVARLHYRGHPNRGVRGLAFAAEVPPPAETPVVAGGRELGRVTSPVVSPRYGPIALAVLRREVADGDVVDAGGTPAAVRPLPFGR
ncbi:MAG: CAF17-like 4Fe-4S cluster assembly/insertion protein YgfZ [Gaiellales bacterium]